MLEKFPQINPVESEKQPTLKDKLQKAAMLGTLVAAAAGTEACSPNTNTNTNHTPEKASHIQAGDLHPETKQGRLKEQYELHKKQSQHEARLILGNDSSIMNAKKLSALDLSTNTFLKYYYQGLNGERNRNIFEEGRNMRVLEIAKKKGIELDLSKNIRISVEGGIVPTSAEVNGVVIPISESDYTPRELELVRFTGSVEKDGAAKGTERIRTSPDFDKGADF